jgi:hypothetical protein
MPEAGFLLGALSDLEIGGDMFIQNVGPNFELVRKQFNSVPS